MTSRRSKFFKSFQLSNRTNCSSVFANMPADVFFQVCSFLDFREICRIGRVCVRWYRLTRSQFVWYRTDILMLHLTPEKSQKLMSKLPPCVDELRIGQPPGFARQTMWLPALFFELRERCPHLKVLIIENAALIKAFTPFEWNSGYMLNCKVPESEQVIRYYNELNYFTGETDTDFRALYYLLRNLSTLSLRNTVFAVEDIFPSESAQVPSSGIKVLDVTHSLSAKDKAVQSFCRLPNLEELYLSGTAVTVNGVLDILATLHNLKVLDLDGTVVGGETFSVLKEHGKFLIQVYMAETAVKDSDLVEVNEDSFPNLQKLCLRSTRVTEIGVKKLLDTLRSLTCVIVTKSGVLPGWIVDQRKSVRDKLIYEDEVGLECNHFLQNKYRGKFKNGCSGTMFTEEKEHPPKKTKLSY